MTTNQQLKAHCEDVIASPQDHLDWVVDMARVALASLEAEPVYQLIDDGNWWDAPKYLFDEAKERGEQHRVVYTAPPVPESFLIEKAVWDALNRQACPPGWMMLATKAVQKACEVKS